MPDNTSALDALGSLIMSLDRQAKDSLGVCPVCRQPSNLHAANKACARNRARVRYDRLRAEATS